MLPGVILVGDVPVAVNALMMVVFLLLAIPVPGGSFGRWCAGCCRW